MKQFFLVSSLLIASSYSLAQDNRVYFNSRWVVTAIDSARYYRTSDFDSSLPAYDGKVVDYFLTNDQVEMTGQYLNGAKDGEFIFYYADGQVRMILNFEHNRRIGTWKEFYKNGTLKVKLSYDGAIEQLLELNDSLGHSLIKGNKFNYTMRHYDVPWSEPDINYPKMDETIHVTGSVFQSLREGKWTITKDEKPFSSITYKAGVLSKGFVIINNQKVPLTNNSAFPLIIEPDKFYMTENFVLMPGATIRNNYVMEGLHQYKYKSMKKTRISSYGDLINYINDNFVLRSKISAWTIKIKLNIVNGLIDEFTSDPKLSPSAEKDLKLLFDTIENIAFTTNDTVVVEYRVGLEE